MLMLASNSLEPSYWMSMPVASSKAAIELLKITASASVKGPFMVTTVPLYMPL